MKIDSIKIRNFRCFKSFEISANEGINTLVGGNSVGKSTVFLAVSKIMDCLDTHNLNSYNIDDLRYKSFDGDLGLTVICKFKLNIQERERLFELLSNKAISVKEKEAAFQRISPFIEDIEATFEWNTSNKNYYCKVGPLYAHANTLSIGKEGTGSTNDYSILVSELVNSENVVPSILQKVQVWNSNGVLNRIGPFISSKFRCFSEFRRRPIPSAGANVLESFGGEQVATVLLNLKDHTDPSVRNRYKLIKSEFASFFPTLELEAVEQGPGTRTADIQIIEKGKTTPIPLTNIGAGVANLLTLITNLVAQENMVFVVEEPETHLHAQSKRSLYNLIRRSANKNQIFIVTHDSYFLDPENLANTVRLSYSDEGTQLHDLGKGINKRLLGRVKTAMKNLSNREVFFSRAVLLVEDESHKNFIIGCAGKISIDLDSQNIAIIPADGEGNFQHLIPFISALGIPFICLKDRPWGSAKRYPRKRFRNLGCELEAYCRSKGLGNLLEQAEQHVGRGSKQRAAKWVGENISKDEIPDLFVELLNDITKLTDTPETK